MAEELKGEHKVFILDKHEFLNGDWIGAGVVANGKEPEQVIGFRFFVGKEKRVTQWCDMSYQNALILAGVLIKACHLYDELVKEGIDPTKPPEPKKLE